MGFICLLNPKESSYNYFIVRSIGYKLQIVSIDKLWPYFGLSNGHRDYIRYIVVSNGQYIYHAKSRLNTARFARPIIRSSATFPDACLQLPLIGNVKTSCRDTICLDNDWNICWGNFRNKKKTGYYICNKNM